MNVEGNGRPSRLQMRLGGKGWTIGLSDAVFDLGGREMSVSGEEGNVSAHFNLVGRTCPGPCPGATPGGQCQDGFPRAGTAGRAGDASGAI